MEGHSAPDDKDETFLLAMLEVCRFSHAVVREAQMSCGRGHLSRQSYLRCGSSVACEAATLHCMFKLPLHESISTEHISEATHKAGPRQVTGTLRMELTVSAGAAQVQLHVTSCLALVRAAESELIRNKVPTSAAPATWHSLVAGRSQHLTPATCL